MAVGFRAAVEVVLWFAFAWLYFLYLLFGGSRGEHIGIGGAIMALVGAVELCVILTGLGIWSLVWLTQ